MRAGQDTGFKDIYGNPISIGFVDMLNDDYHASAGISKSHLDVIYGKSAMHYYHAYLDPNAEKKEATPALELGQAIHTAALERERFEDIYLCLPTFSSLKTKAGRAERDQFHYDNPGKLFLTKENFEACLRIRDKIESHPLISGLLSGGMAEQSFFSVDEETGELIKCQPDYTRNDFSYAVDLKSTKDASNFEFARSSANYRYPVQEAWYRSTLKSGLGFEPDEFLFLALEKEEPFAMGIYQLNKEDVSLGRIAAKRDFHRIIEYKKANYWPDYADSIKPLEMPAWARM